MKKIVLSTAVVAAMWVGGYYTYTSLQPKDAKSALFLENIEVLSQDEDEDEFSQCPGSAEYAVTGIAKERSTSLTHSLDSMDYLRTFEIEYCYAKGWGATEGRNGYITGPNFISETRVKCNGKHYLHSITLP